MPVEFDSQPIRELADHWMRVGDTFFETYLSTAEAVRSIPWSGIASDAAREAYASSQGAGAGAPGGGVALKLLEAAITAWRISEGLQGYANQIDRTIEKINKAEGVAALAAVFGAVLSFAIPGLGWLLAALFQVVARVIAFIVNVVGRLISSMGALAPVGNFAVNAILGAAITLGTDVFAQALASWTTHSEFHINWKMEGINVGLGAVVGAWMGPDWRPNGMGPKGNPATIENGGMNVDVPTNRPVPQNSTPHTVNAPPVDGVNTPPPLRNNPSETVSLGPGISRTDTPNTVTNIVNGTPETNTPTPSGIRPGGSGQVTPETATPVPTPGGGPGSGRPITGVRPADIPPPQTTPGGGTTARPGLTVGGPDSSVPNSTVPGGSTTARPGLTVGGPDSSVPNSTVPGGSTTARPGPTVGGPDSATPNTHVPGGPTRPGPTTGNVDTPSAPNTTGPTNGPVRNASVGNSPDSTTPATHTPTGGPTRTPDTNHVDTATPNSTGSAGPQTRPASGANTPDPSRPTANTSNSQVRPGPGEPMPDSPVPQQTGPNTPGRPVPDGADNTAGVRPADTPSPQTAPGGGTTARPGPAVGGPDSATPNTHVPGGPARPGANTGHVDTSVSNSTGPTNGPVRNASASNSPGDPVEVVPVDWRFGGFHDEMVHGAPTTNTTTPNSTGSAGPQTRPASGANTPDPSRPTANTSNSQVRPGPGEPMPDSPVPQQTGPNRPGRPVPDGANHTVGGSPADNPASGARPDAGIPSTSTNTSAGSNGGAGRGGSAGSVTAGGSSSPGTGGRLGVETPVSRPQSGAARPAGGSPGRIWPSRTEPSTMTINDLPMGGSSRPDAGAGGSTANPFPGGGERLGGVPNGN
ncbi:hypothetical protein ACI2LP_04320, partial [Streptomyces sp. NPDC019890]